MGKVKRNTGSAARTILRLNGSAMRPDDGVANGQPQTDSPFGVGPVVLRGIEHFENVGQICRGDSLTPVAYAENRVGSFPLYRDADLPLRRRMLDRIVQQIDQHLDDQPGVMGTSSSSSGISTPISRSGARLAICSSALPMISSTASGCFCSTSRPSSSLVRFRMFSTRE